MQTHMKSLLAAMLLTADAASAWAQRPDHMPAASLACPPGAKAMKRVELLFGMRLKAGRTVGDAAWRAFLADEVTPRFPDGLTVLPAYGQWRAASGRITREPARLLLILLAPTPDSDADIEAVRDAFKRRFEQESVVRVESSACVSF